MIQMCKNKDFAVFLTEKPIIEVRCPEDAENEKERQEFLKKPFVCKNRLWILLLNHKQERTYKILVNEGYAWDGASIPRIAWRLIGSPSESIFLRASLVHDKMCENKNNIGYDRAFSTNVFNALLEKAGVGKFKRFLMKNSVACFQTLFCDWEKGQRGK